MSETITREQFIALVKGMKAVYTQPIFLPDMNAVEVWYQLLKDIPYQPLTMAVQTYMKVNESSFPPSPAALRKYATKGISVDDESKVMADWALVRKALRNSIYGFEEEYAKLPELAKKAVGAAATLREWAQLPEDEVGTVIQSNFARAWRAARIRSDEEVRLNPDVHRLIEQMQSQDNQTLLEGR